MEDALDQLLGFVAKFLIHSCLSNQSRPRGGMPRKIINPNCTRGTRDYDR